MSVLVVGVSHHSAPVEVLERVVLEPAEVDKLLADLAGRESVAEVVVLNTCNRVEVYAEVERFHQGVEAISTRLAERAGVDPVGISPYLYVRYGEATVAHLFGVACGLDSMVVGESQVLGQVRAALRRGQDVGTIGPALNSLFQQAVRVGRRARAETDIDRAGQSLVSIAMDRAATGVGGLDGLSVLVVGAGSMASLAATMVRRAGAGSITIANRRVERAGRLAAAVGGRARPLSDLAEEVGNADLVVSCTGATGTVLDVATVTTGSRPPGRRLTVVDLALPHDVAPAVADLPGVTVIGLADIASTVAEGAGAADVAAVRRIVTEEVAGFRLSAQAAGAVPTVVALRSMAAAVVEAEMARFHGRVPDLSERARAEVERTVNRVAEKLIHAPSVRVKQLADEPGGTTYTQALRELFELDPTTVQAVTRPSLDPELSAADEEER